MATIHISKDIHKKLNLIRADVIRSNPTKKATMEEVINYLCEEHNKNKNG